MMGVSAGECQRLWGKVQDMAISEPVTITSNGRDRMVLMSTEEYYRNSGGGTVGDARRLHGRRH